MSVFRGELGPKQAVRRDGKGVRAAPAWGEAGQDRTGQAWAEWVLPFKLTLLASNHPQPRVRLFAFRLRVMREASDKKTRRQARERQARDRTRHTARHTTRTRQDKTHEKDDQYGGDERKTRVEQDTRRGRRERIPYTARDRHTQAQAQPWVVPTGLGHCWRVGVSALLSQDKGPSPAGQDCAHKHAKQQTSTLFRPPHPPHCRPAASANELPTCKFPAFPCESTLEAFIRARTAADHAMPDTAVRLGCAVCALAS